MTGNTHSPLEQTLKEKALIDAAVKSAVKQTFAILGVDVDEASSVESFREDLRFGRKLRRASDHAQLAIVGMAIGGILLAFWVGVKDLAAKQ